MTDHKHPKHEQPEPAKKPEHEQPKKEPPVCPDGGVMPAGSDVDGYGVPPR